MSKMKRGDVETVPEMEDFEAKSNFDTVMKAQEIMGDEVKMEKVHKIAGRHKKAIEGLKMPEKKKPISSLEELRAARDKSYKK